MSVFRRTEYGVHSVRKPGYPAPVFKGARVAGALSDLARTGVDTARATSVPVALPVLVMAAVAGVFGATLWGLKGGLIGLGLGTLAGYGVTKMPDHTGA
jgi:hypothetical protein